jgi:hypothetical protein
MEVSVQLHAPTALPPGREPPGTHWIGRWVDPRAGLDNVEKKKFLPLPGLELRPLGRPSRNQSLYRLRYPGSILRGYKISKFMMMGMLIQLLCFWTYFIVLFLFKTQCFGDWILSPSSGKNLLNWA